MTFREELIEAMADALLDTTEDLPDDAEAGMRAALDAALAYRRSEVCPRTWTNVPDENGECVDKTGHPPNCEGGCEGSGRRSVEYPRLAVVGEQIGMFLRGSFVFDAAVVPTEGLLRVFSLHQEEADRQEQR